MFVHVTLVIAIAQQIILWIPKVRKTNAALTIPKLAHYFFCKTFGFKIEKRGQICKESHVLFTANHVSYVDIFVLGSMIKGSFIAKSEIGEWPVFGWLSKLQKTIFLDRKMINIKKHKSDIEDRMSGAERLIIFPEATTSDGQRVLQFKSSLFSVAEMDVGDKEIMVQPVTLAYTKLDNVPMGRVFRPFFAWIGDLDLFAHVWKMIGLGKITIEVTFHEPVTFSEFGTRKKLAQHCEMTVREGLSRSYRESVRDKTKKKRRLRYGKKEKAVR